MKSFRGTLTAACVMLFAATEEARAQQPPAQPSIVQPLTAEQAQEINNSRGTEGTGGRIFVDLCLTCHGNAQVPNAPDPVVLKRMSPEQIYRTLTTGNMANIAKDISDEDKRAIAIWVAGKRMIEGENAEAKSMPNLCASHPPIRDIGNAPAWNGWGIDISNTRFQPAKAARLSAGQVTRLKLKWAFGLPGATAIYAQPTVVDGRVFVSSDAGYIYSLDAATGCVHWSFQAQAAIRSAITFGPQKAAGKFAAYFGDVRGNVYSIDPSSGELLWKVAVDPHPLSRITGAPTLYQGRLYVPVASLEEIESGSPIYICCTFRGMVAALDAESGKQVWKTYTIAETPKVIRQNSLGKPHMGPSGGGVWDSPTLDPKRRAVYIATGNAFSEPATTTSDAIMALSMDTGKVLWSFQATPNDIWHNGCGRGIDQGRRSPNLGRGAGGRGRNAGGGQNAQGGRGGGRGGRGGGAPQIPYPPENCPQDGGPDQDFSGGIILKNLPNGRTILVAGQKPGIVWGLDPDQKGALVWREDVARGPANRGIIFGGAADDQHAYFNLKVGGLVALDLATGTEKWYVQMDPQESMKSHAGATAAVTVIPGVVFSTGLDGTIRAFAANDGRPLWNYNTAQEFKTVNGGTARGGSIGSVGPTVAQGMVFVGSGYTGFQGGAPGNVFLAFEPAPITPPYN